jgi:hypothetical protein
MIRRRLLALCGATFAAAFVAVLSADDTCVYAYSKGTGADHISWCVSSGGNIVRFKSPLYEHIGTVGAFQEGVIICRPPATRLAFDDGVDQAGFFGEPVLVDSSPLTIDRMVTNPATSAVILRLRQKFTTDYARKELVVDMTLTNVSAESQTVHLRRFSNLHADGRLNNHWLNSASGIWTGNEAVAVVMASVYKSSVSPDASIGNFTSGLTCDHERFNGPLFGDLVGNIGFGAVLGPGKSKTFRITYRRV